MNDSVNTTINSSNRTEGEKIWVLSVSIWSLRTVCPIFLVICPIFNWMCIRIFQSRVYVRASSKWYFIFIAIFDTIYVIVTAPLLFLISLDIFILNWNIVMCKTIVFLNYLSCQISAGLLACLSIDRLIATSCLLLYRQKCTTNVSKITCYTVIFLFSVVNAHYLIGYSINEGYCSPGSWYKSSYPYFNVVYLLSYSIIPFTIITICNIFIALSVCHKKAKLQKKYNTHNPLTPLHSHYEPTLTMKDSLNTSDKSKKTLNLELSLTNSVSIADMKNDIVSIASDQNLTINCLNSNPNGQQKHLLSNTASLSNEESNIHGETTMALIDNRSSSNPLRVQRSFSTSRYSASPLNVQKMGVQFQITISLLTVSICFILCTLPNCISAIKIQTHIHDEKARQFWQAMNFFSIIPLLITHSVNLAFYYLSSNMFRDRFKEYYLK